MFADLGIVLSEFAAHPGESFGTVLVFGLVGTLVVVVVHLILALLGRRAERPHEKWILWEKLVYLGVLVSVGVLGATSFFAVLRYGVMEGWLLFAHMFGAGAFVAILPIVAITWCEANRFGDDEPDLDRPAPRFFWFPKLMFWILLISGLTVVMTMLVSMLPLFGTDGLHRLLDIHRYSGLVAVVAAVLHVYSVLLQRVGLR